MENRLFYTPYDEKKPQTETVMPEATISETAPIVTNDVTTEAQSNAVVTTAATTNAPTAKTAPASANAQADKAPTLQELLRRNTAYQTAFEEQVQKELESAKSKWEIEKTMTAEQLASAKTKEKEDALVKREESIQVRERKTVAIELLAAKNLPASLIECVNLVDDFSMNESIKALEVAFRNAVQVEVKTKLAGSAPKEATADPTKAHLSAVRKAAGLKETPIEPQKAQVV